MLGAAGHGQLPLLDANAVRRERVARAVDRLAGRFGDGAVRPASLADVRRRRRPAP